jgi:hypothetical protein
MPIIWTCSSCEKDFIDHVRRDGTDPPEPILMEYTDEDGTQTILVCVTCAATLNRPGEKAQ